MYKSSIFTLDPTTDQDTPASLLSNEWIPAQLVQNSPLLDLSYSQSYNSQTNDYPTAFPTPHADNTSASPPPLAIRLSEILTSHLFKDAETPFANDSEYVTSWTHYHELHVARETCLDRFRLSGVPFEFLSMDSLNARKVWNYVSHLNHLLASVEKYIERRLELSKQKPRLVRLSELYQLSDKEIKGFIFILLYCTGVQGTDEYRKRNILQNLKRFCLFDGRELLNFLSPQRLYFEEGFVECEDEFALDYSGSTFRMSREVLKSLHGNKLTVDEMLKLDNTTLAAVVRDEPDAPIVMRAERIDNKPYKGPSQVKFATDINISDGVDGISDILKQEKSFEEEMGFEEQNVDALEDDAEPEEDPESLQPYVSDLDYLQDAFKIIIARIRKYITLEEDSESNQISLNKRKPEAVAREQEGKLRQAYGKWTRRLALTRCQLADDKEGEDTKKSEKNIWIPRLERLADKQNLDEFEKMVVLTLTGIVISQDVRKANRASTGRYQQSSVFDVGTLLGILCDGLESEIKCRSYFYKRGRLVEKGIIAINEKRYGGGDLMDCTVELDRRMLDYIAGLDTELEEMFDSTSCYRPTVSLDNVILPPETKTLLLNTVDNFDRFRELRKAVGFDDIVKYGKGLVILFYGQSGTGKTMLANALANHLEKKLLVVNISTLNEVSSDTFRILFRESQIQNALVFFDECESLFESRSNSRSSVGVALVELEKFEGIIIMATNRPMDLDEAMHRRISLSIEFPTPDPELRCQIWAKHVPEGLTLAEDINFESIALEYELNGGFIKNAMLQALSIAVARSNTDNSKVCVCEMDIRTACKLQSRGRLKMFDLEMREIPEKGLESVVIEEQNLMKLKDCIEIEKARGIMTGRWGFHGLRRATVVLLYGPSGCGKTEIAKCICYETGRPLQIVNCMELLRMKSNTQAGSKIFQDFELSSAVIVLEHAEFLFQALEDTSLSLQLATQDILFHLEHYPGLIIINATEANSEFKGWSSKQIPFKVGRLLRYCIEVPYPTTSQRALLWKKLIPKQVPLEEGVLDKFPSLSSQYEFNGNNIQNCITRACAKSALRFKESRGEAMSKHCVRYEDFVEACDIEQTLKSFSEGLRPPGTFYI